MDRDALGVTIADIKDAGPECAKPSLYSGRRKDWKRATGWARGWLIDSSLASELLLAGIDINVPGLDLLVDTQAIRTCSSMVSSKVRQRESKPFRPTRHRLVSAAR